MKRAIAILFIGLLSLSLACGLGNGGEAEAPASDEIQIKIANESPYDICYVQISPVNSEEWGDDYLGEDETIEPGRSAAFNVAQGDYDVMLRDCDGIPVHSAAGVSRGTTITVGGEGMVALQLDNASSVEVCYVLISPTTADDWGDDWLSEAESIIAGESRIFYLEPGTYDLAAVDCEEESNFLVEETGVDLTDEWTTWTISD